MDPTMGQLREQHDASRVAILEVVDLLRSQLRERDAEISRLRQQLGQPEEDEQPPPPPPHKRTRSSRVNTTLFRIVDSGAASGIAAYLATSDALRFARTAGRDFLGLFSAEMETFDVGLARMRPFPSGERAAADAALAAVLRRSPRVAALGLGHRTHVSAATLRGVDCWPRLRVLSLRNCFRLSAADVVRVVARCPRLADLDVSSIALDAGDFDTIAALAPTLRALCVSYSGFTLTPKRVIARVAVPRSLARLALYDRDWHPDLSPTLAKSRPDMAWAKIYAYPRVIEKIRAAAHPGLSLAFRTDTEDWSCPPGALDARVARLDAEFHGDDSDDDSDDDSGGLLDSDSDRAGEND